MTSLVTAALFASAAVASAEGGEGGGLVSIEPKLVILQIVNFLILFGAMTWIFRKLLLPGLRKRADQVRKAIEDAEKSRVDMEALKAEHARMVDDVRARTQQILETAKKESARDRDEILHKARIEAQAAVERAVDEIERERLRVVAELRREVADLTVAATRQLLHKEVDAGTQKQLVDEFLSSLDAKAVGR